MRLTIRLIAEDQLLFQARVSARQLAATTYVSTLAGAPPRLLDSVSFGRYGPGHPTSSARTAEVAEDLLAVLCAGDTLRIEAKAFLQMAFTSWDVSTVRPPGTSTAWATLGYDVNTFRGH
jgi:hypothetical protein